MSTLAIAVVIVVLVLLVAAISDIGAFFAHEAAATTAGQPGRLDPILNRTFDTADR